MADLKRWSRNEIGRMRRDMDRLFDELCADFDLPILMCRMAGDLEICDGGDVLVARLELGTLNPDSVRVSVEDRRLIIRADSTLAASGRRESRAFHKEIRLPCRIDSEGVKVGFADGVLEILLPKSNRRFGALVTIVKR
ncbi:MAG: Hsp20/alpha crystallin family protein [Pseudodesulfovibrio sp.]